MEYFENEDPLCLLVDGYILELDGRKRPILCGKPISDEIKFPYPNEDGYINFMVCKDHKNLLTEGVENGDV